MRIRIVTSLVVSLVVLAVPGAASAGGGGACQDAEPAPETGDTVAMRSLCFEPNILHIQPGATVRFVNEDPAPHRLLGLGMGFGDVELVSQGDEVTATFDEPGIYPFMCDLHLGMVGAIAVGDASGRLTTEPVGAVTDTDGPGSAAAAVVVAAVLLAVVMVLLVRARRSPASDTR